MAGSMGELKPLILVVSFLGLFVILTAMIPSEFYAESYEGRKLDIPDYFEATNIQDFAAKENFTIGAPDAYGVWDKKFGFGGWNVWFIRHSGYGLMVRLYDRFLFFEYNVRGMQWSDANGIKVSKYDTYYLDYLPFNQLDANYDNKTRICNFLVSRSGDATFRVYFGFNTTTYDLPSEALVANVLDILFCIGFDQLNTSTNAWNLISMILFFQMPEVHPVINAVVAIPLWISIGYLTYVLILKALPFVGG